MGCAFVHVLSVTRKGVDPFGSVMSYNLKGAGMPAISDVIIADGTSPTPVNHTFTPSKATGDYVLYEDREHNNGVAIGNLKVSMELRRPSGNSDVGNRNLKLVVRVETPILETVGTSSSGYPAVPKVAFRPMIEIIATLPERMTKQQRTDLRALARSFMGHSAFIGAMDDLALPW